jgi:hypothetical protein
MPTDTYTKLVLTVIATCLIIIAFRLEPRSALVPAAVAASDVLKVEIVNTRFRAVPVEVVGR